MCACGGGNGEGRGGNKLLSRLIIILSVDGRTVAWWRGSHGKLEKARENFNCYPFPPSGWRATLIKRGDPGQLARLILKRRQRAPESPLIISLLL